MASARVTHPFGFYIKAWATLMGFVFYLKLKRNFDKGIPFIFSCTLFWDINRDICEF